MATISNPNDPNRNASNPAPTQVSTANVVPNQPNTASTSGSPTNTGQFSTLQKYLGANQNAGARLGNAIDGKLENEATSLDNASNRAIDQSNTANTSFNALTGQTSDFTKQLSQPATAQSNTPTSKAYDVNNYSTNISGQQAAKDIASNADTLKSFRV